jgi:hypothetical protein
MVMLQRHLSFAVFCGHPSYLSTYLDHGTNFSQEYSKKYALHDQVQLTGYIVPAKGPKQFVQETTRPNTHVYGPKMIVRDSWNKESP